MDRYHRDHFDDCELKPTNRQAAVLRRLLSDVKAESGSVIYEAVYRAYGLYLDGQEDMGLWNIVSGGIPLEYVESTPISDVEGSSEWGATLVGGSTLTRSSCDFSDVASDPKPVWMGHNSAFLMNNGQAKIILQGKRSTVIDEKCLDFISADIPPKCAIEVMALPNTQAIGVAVQVQREGSSDSARWFLITKQQYKGMFKRIDDKNIIFTNRTNVILKLGTFNNAQPKFYSKGGQDIEIEKSSNLLCEQDEIDFVRELIYQKT